VRAGSGALEELPGGVVDDTVFRLGWPGVCPGSFDLQKVPGARFGRIIDPVALGIEQAIGGRSDQADEAILSGNDGAEADQGGSVPATGDAYNY